MVRAGIFIGVDQAGDLQKLSDAANRREEDARVGAGARPGRQDSRADAGWPTQKWSEFAVLTLPVMAERMRAGRIGASWGFRPTPSSRQA